MFAPQIQEGEGLHTEGLEGHNRAPDRVLESRGPIKALRRLSPLRQPTAAPRRLKAPRSPLETSPNRACCWPICNGRRATSAIVRRNGRNGRDDPLKPKRSKGFKAQDCSDIR